jgi:hypothetical protein
MYLSTVLKKVGGILPESFARRAARHWRTPIRSALVPTFNGSSLSGGYQDSSGESPEVHLKKLQKILEAQL